MNRPTGQQPARKQAALPTTNQYGKFQATPGWATPANVVGYTYAFTLNLRMVAELIDGKHLGTPYPTLYYRNGHRTCKHEIPENVGWEGQKRE
jgi:hypothetical protein